MESGVEYALCNIKPIMKVSILIPCYNVEAYLPQCLDSIIKQTYRNLQIVLVDDGSSDNTLSIAQEYASRDTRIEVYHQENQGVASTRNNLLDKVKGDYVLFVDSDDWIELDMVEYLVGVALEHNSKFVMCENVINDATPKDSEPIIKILSQEQAVHDFLRHEYFVGSLWNKLLDSSLLHNERFHCGISYGEDALFCWGVLQKVDKVVVTDRQLYHYRMNEGSISHGSFGLKKFSGHLTWQVIVSESQRLWPNLQYIAKARWAVEDTLLIRSAAHSDYLKNEYITILQRTVKDNYKYISEANVSTLKMRFYAFAVARFYKIAKYF